MPLVAFIVTDQHNAEALYTALPAGTVFTTLTLTKAQWSLSPERLAAEYGVPVIARSQQEWAKRP